MSRPKGSKNKKTLASLEAQKVITSLEAQKVITSLEAQKVLTSLEAQKVLTSLEAQKTLASLEAQKTLSLEAQQTLSTEKLTTQPSNQVSTYHSSSKHLLCQLCGKEIYSSPRTIRLTELTGVAGYHRQVEDCYKVCDECAKDLSEYVEKWLIKKGANKKKGYV